MAYMAAGRAGHRPLARTFMAGMAQRGGDVMSHQTLPICSRMPALKVLDTTVVSEYLGGGGAGAAFGAVTQVGPLVTVLIVAGAGATAMCADLGSRTIREEIDAMVKGFA